MKPLFASRDNETLDHVIHSIGDAVCVSDRDMVFQGANLAFANFYGLDNPALLLGKSAFEVYPDFRRSVFYEVCERTFVTGVQASRIGYSANLKTWVVIRCYPIAENRYAMIVHRLTDDLSKSGYLNNVDPLTSVPNRWAFEADFQSLQGYRQNMGLALFDVSHFKKFNETVGFAAGDRVLMEMASRIKAGAAETDRVYRIGNDQFLLMTLQGEEILDKALPALQTALGAPISIGGHEYVMRFHVGLSTPAAEDAASDALRKAELALSHAKLGYSGVVRYHLQMGTKDYDPAMVKEIRDAIRDDQLCLFFQPQIDLVDDRVVGAEALVRWRHPERGLMPPISFLPFAEETGLIQEIDREVVRKSFEALTHLRQRGMPLPISINLSANSVCDPATVELFAKNMQEHAMDPALVCVEITETSLIRDIATSQKVTQALRAMGIKISIDDFGSGYSSMSYLLRYPSQFLKIDQEFVRSITTSDAHQVMVKNMIGLAHGLGIGVVAEGVETEAERKMLRAMGCDLVQGYFYSRPLPMEEFCAWIQEKGMAAFHPVVM